MNLMYEQEFFAVATPGTIHNIDDIIICATKEQADKVVEEERDLTGNEFIVLPVKVLLPVEYRQGELIVKAK